jgi:molybdopterin-synthase adenylyltransferase
MEEGERHADPYFIGVGEPQPAVISLNSTISSLAVTMFLGVVTSLPLLARFQLYDAVTGTVRTVNHEPRKDCIVCSESGALGRGNDWDLPTRKAQSCTQPTNAV